MKTLYNKLMAIAFLILGYASVKIEGDGTFFIFSLMFAIPLFFAKENWIDL